MALRELLLLGNPRLYEVCEPVQEKELEYVETLARDLHDTMMGFREKYHCGRAIAAPQIGAMKRVVYMHIDEPVVFINPVLDQKSAEMIELWDDCMSFPDLLVKVARHKTCRVTFRDEHWVEQRMDLDENLSELLQHEVDHLDGILTVQRAIDDKSIALKSQQEFLR